MKSWTKWFLIGVVSIALLSACKDDEDDTGNGIPESGLIEFTFQGTTYQVESMAYHENYNEGDAYVITGISMDVDYAFISVYNRTATISVGEYPIQTSGTTEPNSLSVFQFDLDNKDYYAVEGSIDLTEKTSTNLKGTFSVKVSEQGSATKLDVSGAFNVVVQAHE